MKYGTKTVSNYQLMVVVMKLMSKYDDRIIMLPCDIEELREILNRDDNVSD